MEWWQRDRPGVLDQTVQLLTQTQGAHSTPTRIPTKEITAPADGYQLRYLMCWDELEVSGVRWLMNLGWCHPATGDRGADCLSNQGAPGRCWEAQFTSPPHTSTYRICQYGKSTFNSHLNKSQKTMIKEKKLTIWIPLKKKQYSLMYAFYFYFFFIYIKCTILALHVLFCMVNSTWGRVDDILSDGKRRL